MIPPRDHKHNNEYHNPGKFNKGTNNSRPQLGTKKANHQEANREAGGAGDPRERWNPQSYKPTEGATLDSPHDPSIVFLTSLDIVQFLP